MGMDSRHEQLGGAYGVCSSCFWCVPSRIAACRGGQTPKTRRRDALRPDVFGRRMELRESSGVRNCRETPGGTDGLGASGFAQSAGTVGERFELGLVGKERTQHLRVRVIGAGTAVSSSVWPAVAEQRPGIWPFSRKKWFSGERPSRCLELPGVESE